jgi:mono/diheme cytochrome c family protein
MKIMKTSFQGNSGPKRLHGLHVLHVPLWLLLSVAVVAAQTPPRAGGAGQGAPTVGPRPTVGPADRPVVDPAAVARGARVWAAECVTCHGPNARGSDTVRSLLRSMLVLSDRTGSTLGPFLKKGHPTQSGKPSASIADADTADISQFLRQRINDTLRGSPVFTEGDILTGDAKAGEAYFNGEGKCTPCHSPTGNLRGIASRLGPVDLQQRMLFPAPARGRGAGPSPTAVTVTITPASGAPMSGVLVQEDDFYVTFRDDANNVRVVKRAPGMKVVTTDPLQAHHELLDRITDKQMHDLVAFLETLK